MFINNLSNQQQSALIKTAELLIASDSVIAAEEENILNSLKSQSHPDLPNLHSFELSSLKEIFTTQKAKVSLMLELVAVALIDEEYHSNERSFINDIAGILDINDATLIQIESWVEKQMDLQKSALEMMEQ